MLKIDDEPVIFITKSACIALTALLREYANRADAGEEARKLHREFITEVLKTNPNIF